MEEEQEACISVSGATTTTRRYNNRSSSREITDPVLEIGGLGFLKTNSLGEGERENIYSVESVTSVGSKNHTLTTEDASVEQLTGNKSVLSGCFKEGSLSRSILGTTKEVNEVEDRQTGCMEKELCILVPSVEFQLKLKRMVVENNAENWVPNASTEDGDLVAMEITEMAEIDCAEVAQTVDSVAIEYGNTKDSGKTKDCSGFDKGSSITDQEDGVGPTHRGGRDRGQMNEGETVTDDLTTAVRQQLRRRAKKKGEPDTSPPGEGESLCNKGKGYGDSKILDTSTQVLEEDFESGVAEAMAVVMKVHGVLEPAADPAASFPGMVGLDTKRECHCCQKPETLRNTIVCDNCESSFHLHCVDLQRKQVAELENWHCLACGLAVGVGCWPLGNTKSGLVRKLADSKISNESDGTRFTENRQLAACCQEALVHGSEGSIATSVNLKAREAHCVRETKDMKQNQGKVDELDAGQPVVLIEGADELCGVNAGRGFIAISAQMKPHARHRAVNPIAKVTTDGKEVGERRCRDFDAMESEENGEGGDNGDKFQSLKVGTVSLISNAVANKYPDEEGLHEKVEPAAKEELACRKGGVSDACNQLSVEHVPVQANNKVDATPSNTVNTIHDVSSKKLPDIAVPSYFLKEDSGKDTELKEKEDTLQMLRSFVAEKHGELGKGWDVVIRRRQGNDRVCDKYFVSPDKQRFRSRLEVVRYLGLVGGKGGPKKRNACVGSRERALVNNSEQTVTKGLKSQIGHGDLPLERLGAMKSWSGELDGPQTLPSGYKSTWHDSETGSLCMCEVVGGEQSRLVFRVTRKSFFPVAELDGVAVVCADSAKHACDNGFDLVDHSTEKDHTRSGRSELSSFVTQKSIDEVQHLQSNIQTRSDPIQRAEALQGMTAPEVIPVGFKPWPLDEIGEFVVEAASPADAWKLFVQEFMTRIRRSHTATKSLCSHFASRIGQKQDAEVSGNASLVFDHELGNTWCQIPGADVEMAERSDENKIHGETGMAVHKGTGKNLLEEMLFKRLEARLAKSQFEINQPVVQEVTQVLQGVGNDNIDKCFTEELDNPMSLKEKTAREEVEAAGGDNTRQVNQTLEGISEEILQENVQSELTNSANQEVSLRSYERSPPPTGQPLGKKLPTELVGDLLEAWEFLHRFSELIGQESLPTFEDLEAGLSDMGLVVPSQALAKTDDGNCKFVPKLEDDRAQNKEGLSETGDEGQAGIPKLGEHSSQSGVEEQADMLLILPGKFDTLRPCGGGETGEPVKTGLREQDMEGKRGDDSDVMTADGSVQATAEKCTAEKCTAEANVGETAQAHGKELGRGDGAMMPLDSELDHNVVTVAHAHIPLLKFLLADMQYRVLGDPTGGRCEEPKKRGRPLLNEPVPVIPEFGGDLPVNEVTWPELAHRYLVTLIEVKKSGDPSGLRPEERRRLIRCLQGDGGVLFGAAATVVAVESDAQVLAEAEMELSLQLPNAEKKDKQEALADDEKDRHYPSDEIPPWVKALEPVRTMPTNVGARIRAKVREALDLHPVKWAADILEWSISRDIFKGNASGPTKRAVVQVLAKFYGGSPAKAQRRKTRKPVASPDYLMQCCRIVLRHVADADKGEVFSILIGGPEGHGTGKVRGMVARPLDFRTIDARLAAGAYGGLPEAFAADVRQIWRNVEEVHGSGSDMVELANSLSQLFESLYQKQVLSLIGGDVDTKDKSRNSYGDADHMDRKFVEKDDGNGVEIPEKPGKLLKAPWEDDDTCRVCGVDEDYERIMLCDGCEAEYHTYCLDPPLQKVPEGNWFCPSCVSVKRGFPEATAVVRGEETGVKNAVNGLEGEDGHVPAYGFLDDTLESEGELPRVQTSFVESPAHTLLERIGATDYCHWSLADRVQFLKILCDNALETPQIRAHLEKSLDTASELRTQLRVLSVKRDQALEAEQCQNMHHSRLPNEQIQITSTTPGQSAQAMVVEPLHDVNTDSWAARLRSRSSCSAVAASRNSALPKNLKLEANVKEGVEDSGGNLTGKVLDVYAAGMNHGADKVCLSMETLVIDKPGDEKKPEMFPSTITETSVPFTLQIASDSTKRKHEEEIHNMSNLAPVAVYLQAGDILEGGSDRSNKRLKSGPVADELELTRAIEDTYADVHKGMKRGEMIQSDQLKASSKATVQPHPETVEKFVCEAVPPDETKANNGLPKGLTSQRGRTLTDMESEGMSCTLGSHISDLPHVCCREGGKADILMSCSQLEDFNIAEELWVKQFKAGNNLTSEATESARKDLCHKDAELAISPGTLTNRANLAKENVGRSCLLPQCSKQKLGMATQLHDGNEENSEEAERTGIFSQIGSVEDKNLEWLLKHKVADVTLESIGFSKMQNGVDGKQLTSSHGTSALGAFIDGPSDAVTMEMAPPLLDDREDLCHEVGPDSGDLKAGRSDHIGEDPTPTNLSKLQPSLLLENNADSAEKLQDSLRKLDAEIGQVETKLWNMNVRRDHLGTDDLGREYWAFCGSDNQPFLVVAEEGFVIEATGVSTSGRMDGGTVESRKMKFKVGCLEDGGEVKESSGGRKESKGYQWWVYKGEEALDNLVSWLISESKGERSLKVSIHEWRRSVFAKHQHPDEELNEVKLPLSCSISGKEGDKSVHPVMMTTRKPSRIGADIFPRVKATVILEARYGSSGESSSSIKQLNRCECLEPLWRTRSHCQTCHETYESSVELLNHQKTCPIVQSAGTDFQEVETQPLSNKRKWGNSSSGMVINSASSERKTESRPGSSKCTRLSGDNEILKRPHSAERLCMIEEASVFSSRPATRSTGPAREDYQPQMNGSKWITHEEPMDPFFCSGFHGDSQLHNEQVPNIWRGRIESKQKKQGSQGGKRKANKLSSTQVVSKEALAPVDYASMQMSFSSSNSTRDRVLQIGWLADQCPTFAPALHFAPVFDPSLMIQPCYPCMEDVFSTSNDQLSLPLTQPLSPPSGEVEPKEFEIEELGTVSWNDAQGSGVTCTDPVLANETGDDFGLFPPEAITLLDYKWDYLVNVPPTTCQVNERLDGDIEGYYPSSNANVDNVVLREDSVPSSTAPLGVVQSEGFKQDTSEQSCGPETAMPVGVTGKKPAKKFPVLEAATCPLVGEQKVILRGLQLRLLDIEAAMTKDMLEPARSSPVRRRAWRFLVKSTTCIYQMTKAIILLEQMVKVEFLKKTWCQWSSLSAAARSVTVSSLALKLYALDASITYRIKGKSDQEKQHATTSGRKGKKKRHLHVKTK